jgi:hypothetical protein
MWNQGRVLGELPAPGESDPRFAVAGIVHLPRAGIVRDPAESVSFEHDPHWTPHGHRLAAAVTDRHLEQIGVSGASGR